MLFDSVDNKVSYRTANCFSYLIVAPLFAMSRVNIYSPLAALSFPVSLTIAHVGATSQSRETKNSINNFRRRINND